MAEDRRAIQLLRLAFAATVVPVVLVLLMAFAVRLGLLERGAAFDLGVMTVARGLAFVGLAVALASIWLWLRAGRRGTLYVALGLAVAVVTVGTFMFQGQRYARDMPLAVTSNPGDPPPPAAGQPSPVMPVTCDGVAPAQTQLLPEQAVAALQGAGFTITRPTVFRVEATREGFWFGRQHDAVVRIRPTRTDLLVTARDDRPDGGATCRLAARISEGLQAGA